MQIENYNTPFLDALSQYDDGCDLSDYNFGKDGLSPPYDDANKRKLAYRHRVIANKYKQVLLIEICPPQASSTILCHVPIMHFAYFNLKDFAASFFLSFMHFFIIF
uniref:protein-tyrosine-phosphatase n=1 Tax=Rhizophora mucronata TaxID=61149 RepID=A0A2P2KHJ8_RHIMU